MAAWSVGGAVSVRILNMDLHKTRCATQETLIGTKPIQKQSLCSLRATSRKKEQVDFLGATRRTKRLSRCVTVACESTSQIVENSTNENKSGREATLFTPNSSQVEALVADICDTTSIAEFELDFGGFRLYLKRSLQEKSAVALPPPAASSSPAVPGVLRAPEEASAASNGPAQSTTALAISKPKPATTRIQRLLDSASDEGLAILQSPKVGFFRRSRTIKGKRGPPSCKEKQVVKEGQVLCFIEQLGGEIPIESDVSGEVIKILREDGEPVGYGDALIAVLPSFPGIKKLQQ
ncbi:single hybrid motif superfamily protein [Wolffia australiana]